VAQLRALFTWFSDVAKIYIQFQPKFIHDLCEPTDRFPKVLKQRFSKVLESLAETVETQPSEVALLNLLPISFPRQMISYSLLFCQLIDTHQRMVFAEYSEISRRELFRVARRFPDPRVLVGWPAFRDLLESQNGLIRNVAEFRGVLGGWHRRLVDEVEGLVGVRTELLVQVVQVDLCALREQAAVAARGLVEASEKAKLLRIIEHTQSQISQFSQLELTFSDIDRDLAIIRELRDYSVQELERIRTYLAGPRACPKSDAYRFPDFTAHINRVTTRSTAFLSVLQECESAARVLMVIADCLCGRQTVLFQTVVRPSLDNLDAMIEALRAMAAKKREKSAELHDAIRKHRLEADRLEAVVACAKQKAKEPEGQCRDCEERRVYVLAKCGHSFCERCLNKQLESRLHICPYSQCNVTFSVDDVMQINWE
jgi:hypothetical protein